MQDDIIRMALESGLGSVSDRLGFVMFNTAGANELQRFASLVAAHEREKQAEQEPVAWAYIDADGSFMDALDRQHGAYQTPLYAAPVSIEAAVLAEREACAKVCEEVDVNNKGFPLNAKTYAAAIRARGNDAS